MFSIHSEAFSAGHRVIPSVASLLSVLLQAANDRFDCVALSGV